MKTDGSNFTHDRSHVRLIRTIVIVPFLQTLLLISGCGGRVPSSGESNGDVLPGPPWFADEAAQRGLRFTNISGHRDRYLMPEIMGGGAAVFDMDGDGFLDIYLVQAGFTPGSTPADQAAIPANLLLRNRGDGKFQDVTAGSGADDRGYGMGVATGDYNNDGRVDLYVTNLGPNVLLRNDGNGKFTDVTAAARVGDAGWGTSAAFLDYNRDGNLDLFVCNYVDWAAQREPDCSSLHGDDYCSPKAYKAPMPDVLYRNNGDGTFTDVSRAANIHSSFGNGLGVVSADFNRDGWPDIFVANDGMPNQLWINQADGTFTDMAVIHGCAIDLQGLAKAGMGVTAADIDDDGDEDFLVCNLRSETDSLYRNEGAYFYDATAQAALAAVTKPFTRFGVAWMDFNNDGTLDLYEANGRVMRRAREYTDDPYAEPNVVFRGQDGKYLEVGPRGGTSIPLIHTSRVAAFGDLDNDGGIDVVVVNRDGPAYLLHNIAPQRGHWLICRVIDEHDRDALGAAFTVQLADRSVHRTVRTAYSYCAANDPRVHIGLGETTRVAAVTVQWIDDAQESFGPFDADQIITLRRGEGVRATH